MLLTRSERQKLGIKKWLKAGGKGILEYCTGFGKTRVATLVAQSFIKNSKNPFVFICVPTEVLKNQWTDKLIELNIQEYCRIEIFNTIIKNKYPKLGDQEVLFIIDEVHSSVAETFIQMFEAVEYDLLLCLTGTLKRLDNREVLLDKYCKVLDHISIEEAQANGWLSACKEYRVFLDVDLTEYEEWSKKFLSCFSYFNYEWDTAMGCATNAIKKNIYAKKMGLKATEVSGMAMAWMKLMHKRNSFVRSHPKKFEIANKILEKRQDKKCITFSATIEDSKKIEYGCLVNSKQTKSKNKITMDEFCKQSIGVLNTSKAADVGVDIPGLSVGIILSCDSSTIRKTQRKGRIIRFEEGKEAELFTLILRGTQEEKWFNNSTDSEFITITEEELELVLDGKEINSRQRENIKDFEYRF